MTFDLEARVRQLEDRVLISDRVISYAVAVDQRDWVLFADCFADPVHADYSENGLAAADFARDDLVDIVRSAVSGYTATQHLSANHVTDFDRDDPDRATCHSSMYARAPSRRSRRAADPARLVRQPPGPGCERLEDRPDSPTRELARGQTDMTDGLDRGEDGHMDDGASPTSTEPDVPAVIDRYLRAHDRRDTDAALSTFAANATVADDGQRYVGADRIREWLANASTQFNYTRTITGANAVDADTWLVTNRLEGDFPGGIVDLGYRFRLAGDAIAELLIAP